MSFRPGFKGWILFTIFLLALFHKSILRTYFILNYGSKIATYSRQHQVSSALISAMIFVESRFNPHARSSKGAMGLMQIMPATGEWIAGELKWSQYSHDDLLEPDRNLQAGIWYIAYLKEYFNHNPYLALASYNAGQAYVTRWVREGIWDGDVVRLEQIPFPETRHYLFKIMIFRRVYRYLYSELLY